MRNEKERLQKSRDDFECEGAKTTLNDGLYVPTVIWERLSSVSY